MSLGAQRGAGGAAEREPKRPPSVDALARSVADLGLPHPLAVDAAREAIARGDAGLTRQLASEKAGNLLQPVVNATGVLLHTNLGRAPLERSWLDDGAGIRPTNLELDLASGKRGSRNDRTAALVARACGAEAALVVNNGAAALFLLLAAVARGGSVVVSRGELVEIGGGFRVPEIMASSGATLKEVGTTNKTRPADYAAAVDPTVAALLKVHQSNFSQRGFTESAPVASLAGLGPPLLVDLGSGLLDSTTPWLRGGPPPWLAGEPAVAQTLRQGAAAVTFSGDKLLGGPQAGVIAGNAAIVAACARHPLARALRPGALVLGALQQTMLAYLSRRGESIPFWRMATLDTAALERRARAIGIGEVVDCRSAIGGGSLPGVEVPSAGIALLGDRVAELRSMRPPIIALARGRRTVLDLRSVDPAEDALVKKALEGLPR